MKRFYSSKCRKWHIQSKMIYWVIKFNINSKYIVFIIINVTNINVHFKNCHALTIKLNWNVN